MLTNKLLNNNIKITATDTGEITLKHLAKKKKSHIQTAEITSGKISLTTIEKNTHKNTAMQQNCGRNSLK